MKILVTGGAGFIGSCLVKRLLETDPTISVVNLDALTYAGNLDNLTEITHHPRYQFELGDIRDFDRVLSLMETVDVCIHAAAETHVDRSITGPLVFSQTNVIGSHHLLEAARRVNLQKFVLVSTDEVYGSLDLDTQDTFLEQTPLTPNSPYSASKASADMLALSYAHTFGLPVSITRCGNNYGPYQYPEKLIPFFILKALKGEKLPVYGDGLNVRDWIHVQDHVDGIIAVMKHGKTGEVYNIGADNQRNNLEITRRLIELLNLEGEQAIQFVEDRLGHDRRYALNTEKIRRDLKWAPTISFEEGLRQTVAWYQANPEWIQRVLDRQQQLNQSETVVKSC